MFAERISLEVDGHAELVALIRFTAPENLAGVPTVCVPGGTDESGVPFGFQIVGRRLAEPVILRVAAAYEAASGFDQRHPSL